MSNLSLFLGFLICFIVQIKNGVSIDYGQALKKSLLFYEAQRSGKLPSDQRVQWRGDSALRDGQNAGIDLVGGYYDAGDNVKFGFPMAYTVTMLAWSVVEFGPHLKARNELSNALKAIKWGTDYLIKAHPEPHVLYGEVGDGGSDHACWQRPEDMDTPRTVYRIDEQHPGADLAGETAAAFAAASVAFRGSDGGYSSELLKHAEQLFEFATKHSGQYQNSIPVAGQFYSSSGYQDELLWAAAWLDRATNNNKYVETVIGSNSNSDGGTRRMFSWDDKYVGAQLLITKGIFEGKNSGNGNFKNNAEQYICNCMQKGNNNVQRTNGGLLWFDQWNNLQYVTSASFIILAYANILAKHNANIHCNTGSVGPNELITFAKSQVDYILGSNPNQMSYMVGFGSNYPKQVHHRGASIVSIKTNPKPVACQEGFNEWFHKNSDNPNLLDGAIVGGPDQGDGYSDVRDNFKQAEPAIANNAPFVGVLARFAA